MKNLTAVLLAATTVFGFATTAFAADLIVDAAPAAPAVNVTDWTGFSVGVQAGLATLTGDEDYSNPNLQLDPYSTLDGSGATLGLFAGYDVQVNDQFVLGIGGEVNWSNVSSEELGIADYHVYEDWQAAIEARAGFLVTPDLLVYGLLGYSWAGFDASEKWDAPDYTDATWTGAGLKVGAGVEAKVADSIFVRAEAALTNYDTHSIVFEDAPYWDITPSNASVKLGLGWKF